MVFGDDGSFRNVMGDDTWVEAWQGGADACATPVAPHDGSSAGTYTCMTKTAGKITITGKGSHLGLPKATLMVLSYLLQLQRPDSITYDVLTATADGKYLTVSV